MEEFFTFAVDENDNFLQKQNFVGILHDDDGKLYNCLEFICKRYGNMLLQKKNSVSCKLKKQQC